MNEKGVKILHVNVRSIFRKLAQLDLLYSNIDFLSCTETWLDARYPDNILNLENMSIFRQDHVSGIHDYTIKNVGGGICLYVHSKYKDFTEIYPNGTTTTKDFEILTVLISKPTFRNLAIITVYKPPVGKIEKLIAYLKLLLKDIDTNNREVWIVGDFNIDWLKRNDPDTVKLMQFCKTQGLEQLIKSITRPNKSKGSLIDLMITNSNFVSKAGVLDDMIADHYTIYCVRKKMREKKEMIYKIVRNYSRYNEKTLITLLRASDWDLFNTCISPDEQWNIIEGKITDILSIMCPYKKVLTRKNRPLWINQDIFRTIRERKRLLKLYRITGNNNTFRTLCILRNRVNSMIDKAKAKFIKNKLYLNSKNPKKFWQCINVMIKGNVEVNIGNYTFTDPATDLPVRKDCISDFLNQFFANIAESTRGEESVINKNVGNIYMHEYPGFDFRPPTADELYVHIVNSDIDVSSCIDGINSKICKVIIQEMPDIFVKLFANSLFFGIFPRKWATSTVILLPKKGDLNIPGNWRPISQTNYFAKIFEKVIHTRTLKYLMDSKILNDYQYGFLPNRSTHEAIFDLSRYIYTGINDRKLTGMLFLDVAKAFNCINHARLFEKFKKIGFSPRCITWFRSYLTRCQCVRINENYSATIEVNAGIAQGTVLGPLLFIFYMNDIFSRAHRSRLTLFADDCVIYFSANIWNNIYDTLQSDLNNVSSWLLENGLRLNTAKTKALIIGSRSKLNSIKDPTLFMSNNCQIDFINQYDYLGTIFDSEMSLLPLYSRTIKIASNKIFLLRKIRKYIDYNTAVSIYKQTILPIFDYSGFLLMSLTKGQQSELQTMQNDVLRFAKNVRIKDMVSRIDLHKEANILSLCQRREKQLLTLMYKLSQKGILRKVTDRATRQQEKYVFKTDSKIGKKYEKSPYYQGTLPKETQFAENIFDFKKRIIPLYKEYLDVI